MRNVWWLAAIVAFLCNPGFACSDEPGFTFGAAEMRAAIQGDWSFTITPAGGTPTQVTVHIDQSASPAAAAATRGRGAALVRAAHACGTRTLVKSANACADVSEMPLAVSYVSGDTAFATAALTGTFRVVGLAFGGGDLDLKIGTYQVIARVNRDGTIADSHLGPVGAPGALAITRL